jgi:hypothetical protein
MKTRFLIMSFFLVACSTPHRGKSGDRSTSSESINSSAPQSWSCSAKSGLMGGTTTMARLEKSEKGYSLFLTDSSGDTGPQWTIKDELIANDFNCKFSVQYNEPLYCISNSNGWATIVAENLNIDSVDQTTGVDKNTGYTSLIVSGTSNVLKNYKNSVLKFRSADCSRK